MAFPHSNCRAEVGVKTIKRLITGNVGREGSLDIDKFQRAILQYRNTPDKDTKLSQAMCLFGRPIRDLFQFYLVSTNRTQCGGNLYWPERMF